MAMQISIPKKPVLHIIAIIWIIFSIIYVIHDVWSDFQSKTVAQAYQQGKIDIVNALIKQAEQCNSIPVSNGTDSIEVVNVKCLQTETSK